MDSNTQIMLQCHCKETHYNYQINIALQNNRKEYSFIAEGNYLLKLYGA